jgi:hypothetical protein
LIALLYFTAGGAWAGRIYVFAALALCGVGAMLVLRDTPWWARFAGATLAMLNPFVYDRLVEGQWGVVVATGGTFVFIAAWCRMRRRPGIWSALGLAGSALLVVAFSANFAGILLVLVAALAVASSDWRAPGFRRWMLVSLGCCAALFSSGVAAFFLGTGYGSYHNVSSFTAADFVNFQSTPAPHLGLIPALVGLYGEWSERIGRYVVADASFPWWVASAAVLASFAVVAAWLRPALSWLLVLGAFAVAVSASTAFPAGQSIAVTLANHVPLVDAYREPQKWLVLWLVALVVLASTGVQVLAGTLGGAGRMRSEAVGPVLAALVIAAAIAPAGWVELRHTADVVSPVQYPASWDATAAYLRRHVAPGAAVAVLPWHLYETLPFTGRETIDPAADFFPGRLLTSADPELPGKPPVDPIGSAAERGSGCALASALHDAGADRALVITAAPAGAASLDALIRCGFATVFDADGEVEVLARS